MPAVRAIAIWPAIDLYRRIEAAAALSTKAETSRLLKLLAR